MKQKKGERPWDQPDIGLEWPGGASTRIFVLGEEEYIRTRTSTNYDHTFDGPAVVVLEVDQATGFSITERYVEDPRTWQFVSRMIRRGAGHYQAEVTSPVDREED